MIWLILLTISILLHPHTTNTPHTKEEYTYQIQFHLKLMKELGRLSLIWLQSSKCNLLLFFYDAYLINLY
ncbi:hypothetical protein CDL12_10690 [Handroanthus impetiginosus]|uniref:Secreted protein n=1 Tax=Handroanthus impetiginosus TaxID=429701 RepID=A0A2G9HGM5_9LAMI|nr:hypothetical protein CDL12_10690 [Handroanthus impetiginosus]